MRGLRLARKHLYLEALDIYAQHPALDFVDALCVVHMQHAGIDELLSYDRDFDRIGGINRVEP
jgi:predicted nucleic acid-binding protein